ncbi:MAG: hypothetical protein WCF90_07005 [Methanomicrobiales archaeon]
MSPTAIFTTWKAWSRPTVLSMRGQALDIVAMFTMLGAALGPVAGEFLTRV